MKVKWLGHAAFVLTAADNTRLITDPYVPGAYNGAVGYGPIQEAVQGVTVSHEHADHNGVQGLPGKPQVIRGKGEFTVGKVKITGVDSYHDNSAGSQRGTNTIFRFEIDGLVLCHLGDLGHLLPGATAKALGRVDVLLVPVGGFFTIDATEAQAVTRQLGPRVVIPMHFKTPKLDFAIAGVDDFLKGQKNVKRIGRSEVEIVSAQLPKETETWVLEPAL